MSVPVLDDALRATRPWLWMSTRPGNTVGSVRWQRRPFTSSAVAWHHRPSHGESPLVRPTHPGANGGASGSTTLSPRTTQPRNVSARSSPGKARGKDCRASRRAAAFVAALSLRMPRASLLFLLPHALYGASARAKKCPGVCGLSREESLPAPRECAARAEHTTGFVCSVWRGGLDRA